MTPSCDIQDTPEPLTNRLRTVSWPSPRCLLPRRKIRACGVARNWLSVGWHTPVSLMTEPRRGIHLAVIF